MSAVLAEVQDAVVRAGPELRGLALQLEGELLQDDFPEFVRGGWHVLEPGVQMKWGWALDAICEHLEAVTSGEIRKLLMNVPPGCMKSLLTGVFWPAWEWAHPELRSYRYLGTSHKQDLAVRDNLKCRRLIQSAWYQARWPMRLLSDQNAKTKFENEHTGFREAMAFTSMTGSRGDRIILDDPLSVDDGNSPAAVQAAETTFTEALPTRVNNERSATVVIMQRLNEGDTSGVILTRDLGYTHLMLPMRFEPERRCVTSIGFKDPRKKDGELLFPDRFSEKQVSDLERTMGSYAVAGQLQQNPVPRGGGMFKTDEHLQLWPATRALPDFTHILQSYDSAFTDNTANDPCACTVWGFFEHKGRKGALLVDAWDDHLSYPKLRKRIMQDWKAVYGGRSGDDLHPGRRADTLLVEDKGSGIAVIQELRQANVPAQRYNPGKADKYARASLSLPLFELDVFYVLESSKERGQPIAWARPFVTQLKKFGPGVAIHDDYVDTFTQMVIFARDADLLTLDFVELEEEEERDYHSTKQKRNPYD